MTRSETAQLLTIIRANYSTFRPADPTLVVDTWVMVFEDYSFNQVSKAFAQYLKTDTSGFAPVPGQLIERISQETHQLDLSEGEAWGLVYKAICRSNYSSKEEFEKLPPLVQKAVGSHESLRAMAADSNFDMGVESSNFKRAYRTCLERARYDEKISNNLALGVDAYQQIGVTNESE